MERHGLAGVSQVDAPLTGAWGGVGQPPRRKRAFALAGLVDIGSPAA